MSKAHNSRINDCKIILILNHFYSLFSVVFCKLLNVRLFLKLNGENAKLLYDKLLKLNG